ncbi:hypothetical protein CAY59_26885 (plasmid) [Vibrio campbellii]|uniref:hypothetical protein n=1 Tax=Vibrio campbellii TaxID=680 RepID=UPI000A2F8CCF|nr:hypothetical protein [Vibrio campbellii]ARR47857.1 hypothetical protein CAY59_26885 [Vibrio campbellii]
MIPFNNNVDARKIVTIRALFRYLTLRQLEKEGILTIADYQKHSDYQEERQWAGLDKLERQITFLAMDEVKNLTHLDDDDKNEVWQGLVWKPISHEELGLKLKQPLGEALCINEELEPIDGTGFFSARY